MSLNTKLDIKDIVKSPNLVDEITKEDIDTISRLVIDEYEIDLQSRAGWEKKTKASLDLALQVMENKTFPWPGASNVKFPLITIAALQFHARAYPALLPSADVVKCRVFGEDPTGEKTARAKRVGAHMSYQVLEEDIDWEDQMDKVLISLPIVGCAFKKSYFDPVKGHNISEHILAKDLVIPYFAKSLESAMRLTHVIELSQNDIYERVSRGIFSEPIDAPQVSPEKSSILVQARENSQGVTRPVTDADAPITILEQHRYLDLDGDGYAEPYIVFVNYNTKQVMRIVARFFKDDIIYNTKKEVISITPMHFFTKFSMIPSPDGGIYDLGFGALLGPLNESINTMLNQLVDAGTMANTAGGFLGRGAKFRSGQNSFSPFEWKRVDSPGDDLRKNVFPLPVREPSMVLFQLLSLLINYGERIGGSMDILTGQNPGQNTPAETSRTMVEQGMKIFSSIFKRVYRSLKEEFRKQYRLNQLYLSATQDFEILTTGEGATVTLKDYLGPSTDIRPSADPNIVSDVQRAAQAQSLLQVASSAPGYNLYEVHKRYLEALKIPAIEQVLPDPNGPNAIPSAPNPKLQIEQMKEQSKTLDIQVKLKLGMMKLLQDADVNQAKIMKLQAEAMKLASEADGVEKNQQIALLNARIGAAKAHQDGILKSLELIQKSTESAIQAPKISSETQGSSQSETEEGV